jgi:hypothetical protein
MNELLRVSVIGLEGLIQMNDSETWKPRITM